MLYDISLVLSASYDAPVSGGRHAVCVGPRDLPGEQRVHALDLAVTPRPAERIVRADFFGNNVVTVVMREPHDRLDLRLTARVERFAPPVIDLETVAATSLDAMAETVAAERFLGPDAPHHYLAPSARVRPALEIAAWARAHLTRRNARTAHDAMLAVGEALHAEMTFDAGATTVDTPLEEAFARRHGVCQDFTHIMIAALRGVGVPAGYISGYLRTLPPPGQPRLEGADAMHAWARVWCGPAVGWVAYDPTNAVAPAQDHIVAAYGRDYSDVSPMHGVLRTAGSQTAGHQVDVIPVEGA